MKPIDPVSIKQAVKDGQLYFYTHEQWNGTFIYCKDTATEERVCVGECRKDGADNDESRQEVP